MKKRIACAFLFTLLFLTLAPLSRVTALQDNKPSNQSPNVDAAKATTTNTPAPVKASADDVAAPKLIKPDDKIVLGIGVVNVIVSVTDPYGRFVTGLGKDHFDVFDDKVKQQIAHFTDEDSPVSLGIVYDVSGSMKERIARSVKALRRFIDTSHDDDDFFLIGFNDR
ncbi:MAG TPA: hypothetical protein VF747_16345, partial [Blastocatellia bacterium]